MLPHRRRKKRPNYGLRTVEVSRGQNGFGFTISGQQPCILSCIVTNSPADNAGLRAGDFLISVNGLSVSKLPHDSVVQLIGNSVGVIRMSIAENYYSDSSDEEVIGSRIGLNQRTRPKYPHKLRTNRLHRLDNAQKHELVDNSNYKSHIFDKPEPADSNSHNVILTASVSNNNDINNVSAMVSRDKPRSDKVVGDFGMFDESTKDVNLQPDMIELPLLEYRAIVGYLGTIEMPKQIATSSKFQTVKSCIRKLRQEKRSPTSVLMTILPACLTLKNSNNCILAEYPSSRLSYVNSSNENEHRFFGLVTSATYADGLVCESEDKENKSRVLFGIKNTTTSSYTLEDKINSVKTDIDVAISNSCHVFMIDVKITDHNLHSEKANSFNVTCTRDPIANLCLEFPNSSEYIVNIIRSMYSLKIQNGVNGEIQNALGSNKQTIRNNADPRLNVRVGDPRLNVRVEVNRNVQPPEHDLLPPVNEFVANSPQPSNHSEITTTSSNSDSGIGFHNDCTNISDRILVVDFANPPVNARHIQHNRPVGINGAIGLEESDHNALNQFSDRSVNGDVTRNLRTCPIVEADQVVNKTDSDKVRCEESRLTVRAMPDPCILLPVSRKPIECSFDERNKESHYETVYPFTNQTLDEIGNIVHERPIDVPIHDFYSFESQNIRNSILAARSCEDMNLLPSSSKCVTQRSIDNLSMYSSKSHEPFVSKRYNKHQTSIDDVSLFGNISVKKLIKCSDFIHPDESVKALKSHKRKKVLNLRNKRIADDDPVDKQSCSDVLLNYKLSPQVFGLARPSVSTDNLCDGSIKNKDKCVDQWGSLQELRGRKELRKHAPLEGTLSEPDLRALSTCFHHECSDGDDQSACEGDSQGAGPKRGGVASWSAGFERLLEDPAGLHTFAEFLKKEFSAENIYFWTACERYRLMPPGEDRAKEAQRLFGRHLACGGPEPVNVDSHARQLAEDNLHAAEKDLFLQAQKQIFNLMKFDSYPRFLRSDLHRQCVAAESSHRPLPFSGDKLDEGLRTGTCPSSCTPSKLKKSLSNAEDRRRKSLLPWHRKVRCKSKDRGEQEYSGENTGTPGGGGLKVPSLSKSAEGYSSRSSLASWDAALSRQSLDLPADDVSSGSCSASAGASSKCTLCRVILCDGATTVLQTRNQETVRQLIDKLLEKRGITYHAYEVYVAGTNKPLDVQEVSTVLAGREVTVEQRVVFKLDLPNRKVISVKSKVTKTLGEVLRPILHKYSYRLDLVQVLLKAESLDQLDMSLSVLAADGQRLSIQCKPQDSPQEGWKGEVTPISTATNSHSPPDLVKSRTNGAVNASAGPSLDEITNRVFEELLQVKAEAHSQPKKTSDKSSVKSEDWGSETSSGIFGRFLRRDSNAPTRAHRAKKGTGSVVSKQNTGSSEEISEGTPRKPLIAKWKAGVKLQVTGRSESDELLEGLKRAQRARLEDQRGTEINFELPDFLKDKENFQGAAKLRKIKRSVENPPALTSESNQRLVEDSINVSHIVNSNIPTPSVRLSPGVKPNPAPRLSIGQTQSPTKVNSGNFERFNKVADSTVQNKIIELEKSMLSKSLQLQSPNKLNCSLPSPIKSAFNSLENTVIENCVVADTTMIFNHLDNFNNSLSSNEDRHEPLSLSQSSSSNDVFGNDILNSSFQSTGSENDKHRGYCDPPPLPPKPKILPIKPSNWGQNLSTTSEPGLRMSQERLRLSPKRLVSSDNISSRTVYLDQPRSSSFV